MRKPILMTVGLMFVALAVLGIFLPVLPTTPLLLVAVACFARSSEKLHNWLLTNKTFGSLIKQWHETRSMPRRAKVYAFISIIVAGVVSVYSVETVELKLVVAAVLVVPIMIISKIRTTESLR